MMATTRTLDGDEAGEVDLPVQFTERVRPDIVKKAVEAAQANRRQPYGHDPEAGLKHVTHWKKRSRAYRGIRGRSYPSSRTPRKITFRRGMQMSGPGGEAPQTTGGRKAHGPNKDRDLSKDINDTERRKAIRSAIAATADADAVRERGHDLGDADLPLVADDDLASVDRTAEMVDALEALGLADELDRVRPRQQRAGKGTMRGRPTREKAGPLVVVDEDDGALRAARNVPGVEACEVDQLNAELLAPGAEPGRLVVWTEGALQRLDEEGMFR